MHLIVDNKSLDGYIWKCENLHKKFGSGGFSLRKIFKQ
jgi:hypothetical protein